MCFLEDAYLADGRLILVQAVMTVKAKGGRRTGLLGSECALTFSFTEMCIREICSPVTQGLPVSTGMNRELYQQM